MSRLASATGVWAIAALVASAQAPIESLDGRFDSADYVSTRSDVDLRRAFVADTRHVALVE